MSTPYTFGSDIFPGLMKIIEEATELLTVLAKLVINKGSFNYWEDRDLKIDLENEIADTQASLEWFIEKNKEDLDIERIEFRKSKKLSIFDQWHKEERVKHDL